MSVYGVYAQNQVITTRAQLHERAEALESAQKNQAAALFAIAVVSSLLTAAGAKVAGDFVGKSAGAYQAYSNAAITQQQTGLHYIQQVKMPAVTKDDESQVREQQQRMEFARQMIAERGRAYQ